MLPAGTSEKVIEHAVAVGVASPLVGVASPLVGVASTDVAVTSMVVALGLGGVVPVGGGVAVLVDGGGVSDGGAGVLVLVGVPVGDGTAGVTVRVGVLVGEGGTGVAVRHEGKVTINTSPEVTGGFCPPVGSQAYSAKIVESSCTPTVKALSLLVPSAVTVPYTISQSLLPSCILTS